MIKIKRYKVSLVRIQQPIIELKFNICLNFESWTVKTYSKKYTIQL